MGSTFSLVAIGLLLWDVLLSVDGAARQVELDHTREAMEQGSQLNRFRTSVRFLKNAATYTRQNRRIFGFSKTSGSGFAGPEHRSLPWRSPRPQQ